MSDDSTRRRFLQVTSSAAIIGLAGCSASGARGGEMADDATNGETDESMAAESMNGETEASMDDGTENEMQAEPTTFTVRIANVSPGEYYDTDGSTGGAIWLTPGAYAVHAEANPVFTPSESASIGLEALAEAGLPTGFEMEDGLVTELRNTESVANAGVFAPADTVEDPNDPKGSVPGAPPIASDGAFEFEVEAEPGQRLSFASMFVPSNDLFFAPEQGGIPLFDVDDAPVEGDVTENVALWDAGTEPNQEPGMGDDQAPAQDSPDQGADEGGSVRRLDAVDDGYDYPDASDAVEITVTPQ